MEETEKKDIQDAEISEADNEETTKKNYRTEVILIFIIGLLIGVMVKAEAIKRVSIGFNDYKVETRAHGYDIEAIEKSLFEESEEEASVQNEAADDSQDAIIIEEE